MKQAPPTLSELLSAFRRFEEEVENYPSKTTNLLGLKKALWFAAEFTLSGDGSCSVEILRFTGKKQLCESLVIGTFDSPAELLGFLRSSPLERLSVVVQRGDKTCWTRYHKRRGRLEVKGAAG